MGNNNVQQWSNVVFFALYGIQIRFVCNFRVKGNKALDVINTIRMNIKQIHTENNTFA